MIDPLFNDAAYAGAKRMMDATLLRHEAIASNLANVETPGYKRLDLDPSFAESLQRAVAAKDTHQINSLQPTVIVDKTAQAHGRDGNTVQLENELGELSQNTVEQALEARLITGAMLKLRLAILGRPI
jgi:flagellar basal-body rod protein FlgB